MPNADPPPGKELDEQLEARVARAELRARYYEAQIRLIEARRKLAALRVASPAGG